MSKQYTYETQKTEGLETFEWDSIWREYTNDNDMKRVLLIGNSISCGYREYVNKNLEGIAHVDIFGTSKGIDNPYLLQTAELVIAQQKKYDVIQINNGLHGWHLSTEKYKKCYAEFVEALVSKHPESKFIIATSTAVRKQEDLSLFDERTETIKERNKAVIEIANNNNIPVNDIYSLAIDKPELTCADGVHFLADGYVYIAEYIAEFLKKYL